MTHYGYFSEIEFRFYSLEIIVRLDDIIGASIKIRTNYSEGIHWKEKYEVWENEAILEYPVFVDSKLYTIELFGDY
ncbi:hypothetical protein NV377_04120 [Paenibacillus sp. T3-5-0-4]|nr:hypothetical protein [Paenibacillus endoradicis]